MRSEQKDLMFKMLLPKTGQTIILQASLLRSKASINHFLLWLDKQADKVLALADRKNGARLLLPLLYSAVRNDTAGIPRSVITYLRTAYLREEIRCRTYFEQCDILFQSLKRFKIQYLVLKGAAVSLLFYPDSSLRHCHDIDLLVNPTQIKQANLAFMEAGFKKSLSENQHCLNQSEYHLPFMHVSGLPAILHTMPFKIPRYNEGLNNWMGSIQMCSATDFEMNIMSPPMMLLHLLLQAAGNPQHRYGLLWVCDAYFLLTKERSFDWDSFLQLGLRSGAAPVLFTQLNYLSKAFSLSLPEYVTQTLGSTEVKNSDLEIALFGFGINYQNFLKVLMETPTIRAKSKILKWLILPYSAAVTGAGKIQSFHSPASYYSHKLKRAIRSLRRHALYIS